MSYINSLYSDSRFQRHCARYHYTVQSQGSSNKTQASYGGGGGLGLTPLDFMYDTNWSGISARTSLASTAWLRVRSYSAPMNSRNGTNCITTTLDIATPCVTLAWQSASRLVFSTKTFVSANSRCCNAYYYLLIQSFYWKPIVMPTLSLLTSQSQCKRSNNRLLSSQLELTKRWGQSVTVPGRLSLSRSLQYLDTVGWPHVAGKNLALIIPNCSVLN